MLSALVLCAPVHAEHSFKRIKVATSEEAQSKLIPQQKEAVNLNRCLLNVYANKGDEATAAIESLKQKSPDSELPGLLEAAMYHRQKNHDKCEEVLKHTTATTTTAFGSFSTYYTGVTTGTRLYVGRNILL